jgi:ribosome maturation factor RimP
MDALVRDKILSLIATMGYEAVGLEWAGSNKRRTLRVYIDKSGGISLEDCMLVSRQIDTMLDVEEACADRYHLEVSSPGLNRPLFTVDHYARFVGHRVKLKLNEVLHGQQQWFAKMVAVDVNTGLIEIDTEVGHLTVPFAHIEKANVVVNLQSGQTSKREGRA